MRKKRDDIRCKYLGNVVVSWTNVPGELRNWAGNATLVFYGKNGRKGYVKGRYPLFYFFLPLYRGEKLLFFSIISNSSFKKLNRLIKFNQCK